MKRTEPCRVITSQLLLVACATLSGTTGYDRPVQHHWQLRWGS
jgi:hypothetical protein